MNEILSKGNLERFTKAELFEMFPSLEIKQNTSKPDTIDAILTGDPTDGEMHNYALALELMENDEALKNDEPKKTVEPAPVRRGKVAPGEPAKPGKYAVVNAIREDGGKYLPGNDYLGKRADYFLGTGDIRLRG